MNLYLRELRANLKAFLIWSISAIALISVAVAKYYRQEGSQTLTDIIATMPKSIQTVFGFGKLDLSTAIGAYGIIFMYITLLGTLYAANIGSRILSKEETDKTFEFLYCKGVSRNKILTSKMIAMLTYLLLFTAIIELTSVLVVKTATKTNIIKESLELMIGLFLLKLLFAFLGMFLSVLLKKSQRAASLNAGILLVLFFLSIVTNYSEKFSFFGYVTPYAYFDAKSVIPEGINAGYAALTILVICGLAGGCFYYHKKRDFH